MFRRTFNFETFCNITLGWGNEDDWNWYPLSLSYDYSDIVIVNTSQGYSFELSDVEDTFIKVHWWSHDNATKCYTWFWDVNRRIWVNSQDVQIIPNRLMGAIAQFLEEMCARSFFSDVPEHYDLDWDYPNYGVEIDDNDPYYVGGRFTILAP